MIVVNIVAKVQNSVAHAFGPTARPLFTSNTLLAIAKELGYIEGRHGQGGGFYPTDQGLSYVGLNVSEYRLAEAQAKKEVEEAKKKKQKESRDQKKQIFNSNLSNAGALLRISN